MNDITKQNSVLYLLIFNGNSNKKKIIIVKKYMKFLDIELWIYFAIISIITIILLKEGF